MPFDERRLHGPPADRFQAERPSAGEQIDRMATDDPRPNQIEDRLADAVFHRPRSQVAAVLELSAAKTAADDSQADNGRITWAIPRISRRPPRISHSASV